MCAQTRIGGGRTNKREELIRAGINEINRHGVTGFSIRRVAESCGVSCAAPAKHFGDRKGFLAAIIEYVNRQWTERQLRILRESGSSLRAQIVGISVEYVKFLVENPHFRSIIMMKDDEFDSVYSSVRSEMSEITQRLVQAYCESVGMTEEIRRRKLYVVRALIYGAALMFDNGELEYSDGMLEIVRASIDREFDLP